MRSQGAADSSRGAPGMALTKVSVLQLLPAHVAVEHPGAAGSFPSPGGARTGRKLGSQAIRIAYRAVVGTQQRLRKPFVAKAAAGRGPGASRQDGRLPH